MRALFTFLLLILPAVSFSQDDVEITKFLGGYRVSPTPKNRDYSYLTNCEAGKPLTINWLSFGDLNVIGLAPGPLVFREINEGGFKEAGFLLGSVRRYTEAIVNDSETEIQLDTYVKTCEGDLSGATCLFDDWLNPISLTITEVTLEDGKAYNGQVTYKPFQSSVEETCNFTKIVED